MGDPNLNSSHYSLYLLKEHFWREGEEKIDPNGKEQWRPSWKLVIERKEIHRAGEKVGENLGPWAPTGPSRPSVRSLWHLEVKFKRSAKAIRGRQERNPLPTCPWASSYPDLQLLHSHPWSTFASLPTATVGVLNKQIFYHAFPSLCPFHSLGVN